jgi:hypothetical protein
VTRVLLAGDRRQLKIRTSYKPVAIRGDRLVLFHRPFRAPPRQFDLVIKVSQPSTP